jgi:hypothetical protein
VHPRVPLKSETEASQRLGSSYGLIASPFRIVSTNWNRRPAKAASFFVDGSEWHGLISEVSRFAPLDPAHLVEHEQPKAGPGQHE